MFEGVRDGEEIGRKTENGIWREQGIIGRNPVGGGVVGLVREKEIEVAGRRETGSMHGGAWEATGR